MVYDNEITMAARRKMLALSRIHDILAKELAPYWSAQDLSEKVKPAMEEKAQEAPSKRRLKKM